MAISWSVISVALKISKKYALIKLGEPKWLSVGSHTSVFNGGPLESNFGSLEIQKHVPDGSVLDLSAQLNGSLWSAKMDPTGHKES